MRFCQHHFGTLLLSDFDRRAEHIHIFQDTATRTKRTSSLCRPVWIVWPCVCTHLIRRLHNETGWNRSIFHGGFCLVDETITTTFMQTSWIIWHVFPHMQFEDFTTRPMERVHPSRRLWRPMDKTITTTFFMQTSLDHPACVSTHEI
ncbi:hypothetical protein C0J52_07840 [Blattella germanica]|nr:hypothetical protein C0J52_07840 [Blattella germanica]